MRFAVLMTGAFRETPFLCALLPYIVGDHDFDLYLCLRQTVPGEVGKLSQPEVSFLYPELSSILSKNVFLNVLPPYDREAILQSCVLPVGPDTLENEIRGIAMFRGIFAGVRQLKASCRHYDYVIRTRTDYLFWDAPLFDVGEGIHTETGGKILVDAQRTCGFRYQDKPYLPWQGSISELFTFSSQEQFFRLWDFEERLLTMWTGVSETTFFRNALFAFTGESVQHPRRDESFIQKHFHIIPGSYEQSDYYFRHGVVPGEVKDLLLEIIKESALPAKQNLSFVRAAYRFFQHPTGEAESRVLRELAEFGTPLKSDLIREFMRLRV